MTALSHIAETVWLGATYTDPRQYHARGATKPVAKATTDDDKYIAKATSRLDSYLLDVSDCVIGFDRNTQYDIESELGIIFGTPASIMGSGRYYTLDVGKYSGSLEIVHIGGLVEIYCDNKYIKGAEDLVRQIRND